MGIERLMELIVMPDTKREGYYIGAMDSEAVDLVVSLAHNKRKTDKVIIDYKSKNLQKHLKAADKINAKYCAVIGSNEINNDTIWLKDLANKTEETIFIKDF